MSTPDVLRALGCWLWQIDPATERVVTIGGCSPFGATTASWRTMLRQCAAEDRHALLDAVRRLGSSDEDGTLRVENLAIPAAGGHGHHIDLLIGHQRDGTGARQWSGMVSRRWPSARQPVPAVESPETLVAGELDAAGLGWWSMENVEEGLSLSRTAARLMGFGDSACTVPLDAWLAAAPPRRPAHPGRG